MINRQEILDKFNSHCAYCGDEINLKSFQVDHIIPKRNFEFSILNKWEIPYFLEHLTEGDVNHIDNLFPSCRVCNKRKDTHSLEAFRNELHLQLPRANKTSSNYRMAKKFNQVIENPHFITFFFEKDWGLTLD